MVGIKFRMERPSEVVWSGPMTVRKQGGRYSLDAPRYQPTGEPDPIVEELTKAMQAVIKRFSEK
jgi:hypothetical protein